MRPFCTGVRARLPLALAGGPESRKRGQICLEFVDRFLPEKKPRQQNTELDERDKVSPFNQHVSSGNGIWRTGGGSRSGGTARRGRLSLLVGLCPRAATAGTSPRAAPPPRPHNISLSFHDYSVICSCCDRRTRPDDGRGRSVGVGRVRGLHPSTHVLRAGHEMRC